MNCRRVRKSLIEYTEGALSVNRRQEVARHLETCDECSSCLNKLALSASTLGSLEPIEMPEEASGRVLENITARKKTERTAGGFFHSPRVIATAGAVTAVLIALAIVVGVFTSDRKDDRTKLTESTQPAVAPAGGTQPKEVAVQSAAGEEAEPLVLPVAAITANDYTEESIQSMAENLEVKNRFAERYTLTDAVNLRTPFIQKLADEFVSVGGDGPMLEAMISFIQSTEPLLLPCYCEQAHFSGQMVYIIALTAPPRSGSTKNLTRAEFWAFNPAKFEENPDTSLVWWGQSSK